MPHRLKLYSAALGLFAIFTWVIWIRPPADGTSAVVARAQVGTPMAPAPVAPINTPALVVEEANGSSVKPSTMGSVASDSQPSNSTFAAISDFAIWSERYLAADGSERRSMASRGIALARERRAALRELIQKDPESALNAAAPWELRRVLPPEFHQFLEQPVNALAQYGVTVASDFENQTRQVSRRAVIGGRSYHAFVYGSMSVAGSSPNLPVNGIAIDDALALAETATRVLSPAEAAAAKAALTSADPVCTVSGEPADHRGDETLVEIASELQFVCGADHVRTLQELAAEAAKQGKGWKGTGGGPETLDSWNQGPKRLLFIRVNFPDDLAEPISASAAYELMNNVNTWLVANSYDSTSMITTVTPLLTLPYTKAFYSEVGDGQLLTDARAVAKAAGYDTADFELDAVRFTNVPGYSYGGKAYVRGKGCWLQSSSVGVACHEFGHNYGLWHANYWNGSGASGIGPGSHSEYGDSFDTMGSASAGDKHFSAIHRNIIDWLGDSYVREVTANGTYRLHAVDVPGLLPGRFNALKLYKDFDRDYWVELRHLFAGNSSIQNGVLLRWDPWAASAGGAHLLDATPGSPAGSSSKDDAALVVGRTFADPGAGLFITPVALHGTGAGKSVDVVVNRGSFAANQRPTVSVQAEKTQAATGESVTFTATANDPDGDVLAYDWDFGDLTFGINGPLVTNLWSASGDYVVRCRVSDMKGGWASAHVVVRIGSHSTFSIRGRVTDTLGQPIEGVRVHNGSTSSSSYRGGFTDSDGNYIITRLAAGSHTLSATRYGHAYTPLGGWANPVSVGPDRTGIDFSGEPLPTVGWEIVDGDASESGANEALIRLSRTGSTSSPLTVKYRISGTASQPADYSLTPAPTGSSPYSLTIPAGAAFADVVIVPNQDTNAEGPEKAILLLEENTAYAIGWQAEAVIEIQDDETPTKPTIYLSSSADNRATESGGDTGAFTVNRSGNRTGDILVRFSMSGTATAAADYEPPSDSVLLREGQTSVTVTFAAIDDALVEGDETVQFVLVPDAAYSSSGGPAVITIQDDDPPTVQLLVTDDLAVEGGSATAKVVFQRTGSITGSLDVNYLLSGTATGGSDYSAPPGVITIPAGAPSATLTLTALNDTILEGDETVAVVLSSHHDYNIGQPGTAVVTIQDNEIPTVTLAATDSTATEGGGDNGQFTISRGSSTAGPLEVPLEISGSAVGGADYQAMPASVLIPDGSSSVALTIVAIDDNIKEADEKVTLRLSSAAGFNIGTSGPVSVTLKDNDSSGSLAVGFEAGASTSAESRTSIKLPVVLSAVSSGTVTVNYSVAGGTATGAGADYTLAAGTLSIPAGEILASISFFLVNDSVSEPAETVIVQLNSPSGAALDARTTHTLTIIDDDASVVSVSAPDGTASEGGDSALFRITRTGSTAEPALVQLQISGTASSPSDYLPLMVPVVIPAGESSVDLPVIAVDDATDELDETVVIRLTAVEGGRVGSPSVAFVTIADDDDAAPVPAVSISKLDGTTTEGVDDFARLQFTRSGDLAAPLVIRYGVSGSATSGSDYATLPGTIMIAAGQSFSLLDIQALADGQAEPLEEVVVTLLADSSYTLSSAVAQSIQLLDSPFMGWQQARFSAVQLADPGVVAPAADPDGDGMNNFVEYAFDRDPNRSDAAPLFQYSLEPIPDSAEQLLVVTHRRRIVRPDIDYRLGVGEQVDGIVDDSIDLEDPVITDDGNGVTETVRVRILAPTFHFDRRFVRLKVIRR